MAYHQPLSSPSNQEEHRKAYHAVDVRAERSGGSGHCPERMAEQRLRPLVLLTGGSEEHPVELYFDRASRLLWTASPLCVLTTSVKAKRGGKPDASGEKERKPDDDSGCHDSNDGGSSSEGACATNAPTLRYSWVRKHSEDNPASVLCIIPPTAASVSSAAHSACALASSFSTSTSILILCQHDGPEEALQSAKASDFASLPSLKSLHSAKLPPETSGNDPNQPAHQRHQPHPSSDESDDALPTDDDSWRNACNSAASIASSLCEASAARAARKYSARASEPNLQCRGLLKAGIWAERRSDPAAALRHLQQARRIASLGLGINASFSSTSKLQERAVASFAARKAATLALESGNVAADAIASTHLRELPTPRSDTLPDCADAARAEEHLRMAFTLGQSHPQFHAHFRSAALPASRLVRRRNGRTVPCQLAESDWIGCFIDNSSSNSVDAADAWAGNQLLHVLDCLQSSNAQQSSTRPSLSGCETLLNDAISMCDGKRARASLRAYLGIERARLGQYTDAADESVLQRFRDNNAHSLRSAMLRAYVNAAKISTSLPPDGSIARRQLELAGAIVHTSNNEANGESAADCAFDALRERLCNVDTVARLQQGFPIEARAAFEVPTETSGDIGGGYNSNSSRSRSPDAKVYISFFSNLPENVIISGRVFATLSEAITAQEVVTLQQESEGVELHPGKWTAVKLDVPRYALRRPSFRAEVAPSVGIELASAQGSNQRAGSIAVACSGTADENDPENNTLDAMMSSGCSSSAEHCMKAIERAGATSRSQLQSGVVELPEPDEGATVSVSAPSSVLSGEPVRVVADARGDETAMRLSVHVDGSGGAQILQEQPGSWRECVATPLKPSQQHQRDDGSLDSEGALSVQLGGQGSAQVEATLRWPAAVPGGATVEATLLADNEDAIARASSPVSVSDPFHATATRLKAPRGSNAVVDARLRNTSGVDLSIVGNSEGADVVGLGDSGSVDLEPGGSALLVLMGAYVQHVQSIGVLWKRSGTSSTDASNSGAIEHRVDVAGATEPELPYGESEHAAVTAAGSNEEHEPVISLSLDCKQEMRVGEPARVDVLVSDDTPSSRHIHKHEEQSSVLVTVTIGSLGPFVAAGIRRAKLLVPRGSQRVVRTMLVPTEAGVHRLPQVNGTICATGSSCTPGGHDEVFVRVA